jgi:hypothetical protein
MALGCGLTSVRGNRGKNYKKMNRWFPKNIQRKKKLKQEGSGKIMKILKFSVRGKIIIVDKKNNKMN